MKNGQTIGQWLNWDFESNGILEIYRKNGALLYYECSNGYWNMRQYDSQGKIIYIEDSTGYIQDNRTPEIIEHKGRKYQLIP